MDGFVASMDFNLPLSTVLIHLLHRYIWGKIDVCVEDETVAYLNQKDVQEALLARLDGWTQIHGDNSTYAMIRGASHEAPFSQPERSLVLNNLTMNVPRE
ncbi:Serine carboxypeptidase-like 45 isoform 2 [Tripterygium wilfordii]|uniref:Serine carboxypeptidase-like 45 isoform 2 n=1 Tax=Tripterygium wilfordii TaxID=458696 RepID=A0A7J7D1X7_TRIWF|nr:Serine carboxypeptidase-like 45 isoform 2 [Tripterygium wilfordii]